MGNKKYIFVSQTCISANRIFVQSGVYDSFVEKLKQVMQERLIIGNGLDKGITQGPLINISQLEKVSIYLL